MCATTVTIELIFPIFLSNLFPSSHNILSYRIMMFTLYHIIIIKENDIYFYNSLIHLLVHLLWSRSDHMNDMIFNSLGFLIGSHHTPSSCCDHNLLSKEKGNFKIILLFTP